jgi:tetratricopeptide (TPR) repeat protein
MGHSAEAIREITRARELDPLSLIVNTERGRVLELARRDTAAVEAYAQALEIDSTYELANSLLAQISLRTRRFELADQAIARLMQSSGFSQLTNFRAYAYAVRGNGSAARQALAQITGPRTTRYVWPYSVACIYTALHETPRALEWLEKAYAAHSSEMTALAVDPALDPVRTDPRFRRLMRRMHLDE